MTRRTLFQRTVAAMAATVLARMPLAGATIESMAPANLPDICWVTHTDPLRVAGQPNVLVGYWDGRCPRCKKWAYSTYAFCGIDCDWAATGKELARRDLIERIHNCECKSDGTQASRADN